MASIGIFILFSILFLSILESGCIVFQNTNLTYSYPYNKESLIGKQDVLEIEVLPVDADARNVAFSLYVPPEISLKDTQSKEFEKLVKDQKIVVSFNYSAATDGTFNLTLEVKTPANSTKHNITVNASVPAPDLEIGEFWVYNQTVGKAKGLQVEEIIRIDTIESKEYYVIKKTWEGDPNGTYALSYYSIDTFSEKMTEYYEDGSLLREKTTEVDPPSSDFPFRVGSKGAWSGSITGIGKTEVNGEVVKKEKITVPAGTYTAYLLRKKMSFSMATGVGELWYVPELNGFAKTRVTTNALGTTTEDEVELLEHGRPPSKPRQVQLDIKIPEGYTLYKNDEFNFRLAYPKNWKFSSTGDNFVSYFRFEDGPTYLAQIIVEPVGKMNLTEYRDVRLEILKKAQSRMKITDQKSVIINGREGYQWTYEFSPYYSEDLMKGKMIVFVVDGKGYVILDIAIGTVYNSYRSMFDNIINSFFIRGSPNKFVLS